MNDAIFALINTYHELNAAVVDELQEEPSALEFMRYVARNRPFVVRRAAADWPAVQRWDAEYLRNVMGDSKVRVAMTPLGNADAAVEQEDGTLIFVEPYDSLKPFTDFMDYVQIDMQHMNQNVEYAQTQNDNLRGEYERLLPDLPSDIPFARIALEQNADAVNFWLGNERSTTALHKDNYENIYVQIRGQKHFVLLSPIEMPCVNEQVLHKGRYTPTPGSSDVGNPKLIVQHDYEGRPVPVATYDPDEPGQRPTAYSHLAKPLRVTLREADLLYLPAMWYHKVSQTSGDEGFTCAVNYWYDMDFGGNFWASSSFVRDIMNSEKVRVQYPVLDTNEDNQP